MLGPLTLQLTIFDVHDGVWDSCVLLDAFRWIAVATPPCAPVSTDLGVP